MIIVAATFATGAETGECVCLCVGKLLFVWQQIRKHWWRRYDKLDAIVYTIQIDVHVFLLLFMTIPYLPKAIKISQTVANIIKIGDNSFIVRFFEHNLIWDF